MFLSLSLCLHLNNLILLAFRRTIFSHVEICLDHIRWVERCWALACKIVSDTDAVNPYCFKKKKKPKRKKNIFKKNNTKRKEKEAGKVPGTLIPTPATRTPFHQDEGFKGMVCQKNKISDHNMWTNCVGENDFKNRK